MNQTIINMNVKSLKIYVTVALLLMSTLSFAQSFKVKGSITDMATKSSIPGATIIEKGTNNGTISDIDGNYELSVASENATLIISYVGYKKQEIALNGRAIVNIVLEEELSELDEVVVIGYGIQKKKVVTGAIASVDEEQIQKMPALRVEQAMQGRTAGVQISSPSGQPGETPAVRIRGVSTTNDATPLYIVDGMPVGSIDFLNPGDIESVDVLKDGASSAIYGTRGANGVILITTKGSKPSTDGKMNITYSAYYGIQNVSKTLDMLNADEYKMIMNEGARNAGQSEPFDLNQVSEVDTDWQKELFTANAPITNHDLNISGGNQKSSYSASFSYFSQQGIIGGEKSHFDRITGRINSNHKVNDFIRTGTNLAYSNIVSKGVASNASFNGPYSSALNMDPLTPLYETDGNILNQYPYNTEPVVTDVDRNVYGISNYVGAEVVNPLALLEIQNGETEADKVIANAFVEIEPLKGLIIKSTIGGNLSYINSGSFRPTYYLNGAQNNTGKTSVNKLIERYYDWLWENTATYSKQLGDHNFSVLGGTSASETTYENLSGFNAKVSLADPDNVYLDMAEDTVWTAGGYARHASSYSYFGRVTYDYKSRYAFTGIIRYDGSSIFGSGNRFGTFPSAGVSWLLSDEPFMPEMKAVSFIKLRGTYGINGNDKIGYYQYASLIDKSRGYIFGGGRVIGASPQFIENADIRWEESKQLDIAIDLGFFNDKLLFTADYYIKDTEGLLEKISIPGHVGNDPPFANVGSVRNSGVEISIDWRQKKNDFGYSLNLNASYNKNEMTHIGNDEKFIYGASWAVAGAVTAAKEGLPIGYFYGYQTDGLFQNEAEVYQHLAQDGTLLQPKAVPGDVRFVDVNGDGVIGPEDRTMIGNPTPDWTLGFSGSVDYKNFDFSFLFTGAFGHQIFNGSQRQDLSYTNRTTAILDRWTGEGTSTTVPRYTWSDINNNYRVSDLYIENGDYLRLKNIQIGYNIPKESLSKIKVDNWRFFISGENVLTFTNYSGADPEIGAMSSFDIGIDRGVYPQARTFRIGTSITF